MAAGKINITIEQGATFYRVIRLKDSDGNLIDLTGCTVRAQLRPDFTSTTAYDFTMTVTDPTSGEVEWLMDDTLTSSLSSVSSARWVYDVEVVFVDAKVQRILQGNATIAPEVTK